MGDITKFNYNKKEYSFESVFSGEHIFRRIQLTSTFYELRLLEYVKRFRLKGTYLDLGANIGNHSIYFLNECDCDRVISVEPEPTIHKVLLNNVKNNNFKNKQIDIFNCALGDKECFVDMLVNPHNMGSTKVISENGSIPCHVLDNLFPDLDVSFIKIDTEGYELKILSGSVKLIERCHPVIVSEATPEFFDGLNNFLKSFGYSTDRLNLAGTKTYMWKIK